MSLILLLEDDKLFSESLEDFLSEQGFAVDIASNGEKALELTYKNRYNLYLLDINVPTLNGQELLKILREHGDTTPTIFITSYKDNETLYKSYEVGADDYLKKPIDLQELRHKINAMQKRLFKNDTQIKLYQNYYYDTLKKTVFCNGKAIRLAKKSLELLELLLEFRGETVTKEHIIERLWGNEEFSEGSLRVYISHLKKILPDHALINHKGIGYRIELE
jgi:DNA-binding response OmpR family regulator